MRIEYLKTAPDRAGRYTLGLEDGSKLLLYRQTIEDFGLYTGLELTQEQYKRLLAAVSEMSAKMRAVRIVSAANVSKKDLENRLVQKGEDPAQAQKAVSWLSELHLMDDSATAETIVRACIAKVNRPEIFEAFENSGFAVFKRDFSAGDTRQEMLDQLAKHFGLK